MTLARQITLPGVHPFEHLGEGIRCLSPRRQDRSAVRAQIDLALGRVVEPLERPSHALLRYVQSTHGGPVLSHLEMQFGASGQIAITLL